MITGNEPINGVISSITNSNDVLSEVYTSVRGLTIRQHFAAMAMQGVLSDHQFIKPNEADSIAGYAVKCADALITELNKQP